MIYWSAVCVAAASKTARSWLLLHRYHRVGFRGAEVCHRQLGGGGDEEEDASTILAIVCSNAIHNRWSLERPRFEAVRCSLQMVDTSVALTGSVLGGLSHRLSRFSCSPLLKRVTRMVRGEGRASDRELGLFTRTLNIKLS